MSGTRLDAALEHARSGRDSDVADLMDELRIASISTLPERRGDCLRNAEWLKARLERIGFSVRLVDMVKDGLPVVAAEWNGAPGRPHLTIYGHYDVQPPDPVELWESPPFEPQVRDGHLYARGRPTTRATT